MPASALARGLDERFHSVQITLQRATPLRAQPVLGPRHAPVEKLAAMHVLRFFQFAGMHAQVAVRGLQKLFEIVEAERSVHRQRAQNPQPDALVDKPVEFAGAVPRNVLRRSGFARRVPSGPPDRLAVLMAISMARVAHLTASVSRAFRG